MRHVSYKRLMIYVTHAIDTCMTASFHKEEKFRPIKIVYSHHFLFKCLCQFSRESGHVFVCLGYKSCLGFCSLHIGFLFNCTDSVVLFFFPCRICMTHVSHRRLTTPCLLPKTHFMHVFNQNTDRIADQASILKKKNFI